jgi:hypothetical protein
MVGFWDRWLEQMLFELDFIPFVDTRQLTPQCSTNSYRNYPRPISSSGEPINYNKPCRFITDLFQGFNWLAQDFPGEATSADHRKIAEKGGWTRWSSYSPSQFKSKGKSWGRPVHEMGHAVHFTNMRTYQKKHHYVRGIAGEGFAEAMEGFSMPGTLAESWMMQGMTYYPTIPLSFEGKYNRALKKHEFKSSQPYQEKNIPDPGLGARFYGMQVWWMYVSHYAGKPYVIGWLSGDSDGTPGSTLQRLRFYLAQESLDLGDLFGNFAAHLATWDWPHLGEHYSQKEQSPFQGMSRWCTVNTGSDCSIDDLKIQADVSHKKGTKGEWIEGPALHKPGGFAFSTIRIKSAPGGALYEFGLEFDMPSELYANTSYSIPISHDCREDSRFFSNRIVVADVGSEGQPNRISRPEYYKVPGRVFESVIVRVPENRPSNIYLLAVPTPPFDLEDVYPFVSGYSLVWNFRYRVRRLKGGLPEGSQAAQPVHVSETQMLGLDKHSGNGLVYDCFSDAFPAASAVLPTGTTTSAIPKDTTVTSKTAVGVTATSTTTTTVSVMTSSTSTKRSLRATVVPTAQATTTRITSTASAKAKGVTIISGATETTMVPTSEGATTASQSTSANGSDEAHAVANPTLTLEPTSSSVRTHLGQGVFSMIIGFSITWTSSAERA